MFSAIYGNGVVMGLPPSEIKRMTLWEYQACLAGWNKSQGKTYSVEGGQLSDSEYDALCQLGEEWNGRDYSRS